MRFDPKDPKLNEKINELFASREQGEEAAPPKAAESDKVREQDPDKGGSARTYDSDDDRAARLAETRRRRALGEEGRERERMGLPVQSSEEMPNPFENQANGQMTEYERRSLEILESIDAKMSELGTLQ